MKRLNTRLNNLEQVSADGTLSPAATMILASIYARLHALFLPYRSHIGSWPAINALRRAYIAGTTGISAAVSGQRNWTAGHAARHELETAGFAVSVKGSVETTGLILTPSGRSTAWCMCQELLPSVPFSAAMTERLESLHPCRTRGSEKWVSESKLFGQDCTGDTSDWQDLTDMMLEPAVSGCIDSTADTLGHVFYRYLKPFEELPEVSIEASPEAEDAYLAAWNSELARLRNLDSTDGEICIPLSVT